MRGPSDHNHNFKWWKHILSHRSRLFQRKPGWQKLAAFRRGKKWPYKFESGACLLFSGQCVFFALEERRQKNWYDEKRIKFLHLLTIRVEGDEPPPLYSQPDRNISVLFTPCLILSWLPELRDEVEDIVGDQTNLIWWKILCAYCSLALPHITHNVSLQIMQEYKARSDLTFWVPIFLNSDSTFSSSELTKPFFIGTHSP